MAIGMKDIINNLPPKRSEDELLVEENLTAVQLEKLKKEIVLLKKEREISKKISEEIYAEDRKYFESTEYIEDCLCYCLSELLHIKERINDERIYNKKQKPYPLIIDYFQALDDIISVLSKNHKTETSELIKKESRDLGIIISRKTFGHTLRTHHEKRGISYIVNALTCFGLGITSAKEHCGSWLGVSDKTIRDAIKVYPSDMVRKNIKMGISSLDILESKIDLPKRIYEIKMFHGFFLKESLNFIAKEKTYKFNHPNAKPAFEKFKKYTLRTEKILREKDFLLKLWNESDQ